MPGDRRPGGEVTPSATHVNANGDVLPPPPPVDQPGLVALWQGPEFWFVKLPLGTWLLKSKVVVVALAPPRSARTMPSLSKRGEGGSRGGSVEREDSKSGRRGAGDGKSGKRGGGPDYLQPPLLLGLMIHRGAGQGDGG